MKRRAVTFLLLVFLALFSYGCSVGVSYNGYVRDESPAFTVNEPHDLDYYQMFGY